MSDSKLVTRRDFLKGASCAAMGLAIGVNPVLGEIAASQKLTRVVLIRHKDAVVDGKINGEAIKMMMDQAVMELSGKKDPIDAWTSYFTPDDIVGIKSNEWGPLPTPLQLEQVIRQGCILAGVHPENIDIDERGVLKSEIFRNATALVNTRPMRTHHWAGVGSLLKNYIMFVERPWDYHENSCADLARLWELPITKGKTRLNVLVMLTPLFHGIGAHHFDTEYTWGYHGLVVGTDPVACDAVGLSIIKARRREYFGEERPMKPSPHHIALADTKHGLGTADLSKIDLVKLGWDEGVLI